MFRKPALVRLLCVLFIGTTLLIPAYASNTDFCKVKEHLTGRYRGRRPSSETEGAEGYL